MMLPLLVALTLGQASQSADAATVTQLETTWNEAHRKGDAATLQQLFADDVVVVVPGMRPLSKADSLAVLKSGKMTFERYESSDLTVRVYDDMAIVTGRIQRTRAMVGGGQKMDDDWRFTKVYLRRGGTWRVISFHASNAAP
jgi:uncharacterized protein (TIGR02246 family)